MYHDFRLFPAANHVRTSRLFVQRAPIEVEVIAKTSVIKITSITVFDENDSTTFSG